MFVVDADVNVYCFVKYDSFLHFLTVNGKVIRSLKVIAKYVTEKFAIFGTGLCVAFLAFECNCNSEVIQISVQLHFENLLNSGRLYMCVA